MMNIIWLNKINNKINIIKNNIKTNYIFLMYATFTFKKTTEVGFEPTHA